MTTKTAHLPPASELLQGLPFGDVTPQRPLTQTSVDGRTAALWVLAKYLSEVVVTRTGEPGKPPVRFRIPAERFVIEKANPEHPLPTPSVAFVQDSDYNAEATGLNSYVLEDTRDKFGAGTVLQRVGEQTENLLVEVWCASRAQRRAIHEAYRAALSPTEFMSGVRFRMPDYYDQPVRFTHVTGKVDDSRVGEGRYLLNLRVEMCFVVVVLTRYCEMIPVGEGDVLEGDDEAFEAELEEIGDAGGD